ncbi:hypothetical protein GCM10010317_043220 [Streptomyces mirabilis]|uniref:hypothetical protein n=1 Tax=Streptomyces mirabilis TaxID=68239 RepID=UPI00167EADD5|nr:hypothetical protein [Streptomyces mirabilis]GHD56640.1 hypothetical protein GCM10010317_043220 [Streptomyces mirabilis]
MTVGEAVSAVLDHACYGDVMSALEQQSGSVVTYIAEVHRDHGPPIGPYRTVDRGYAPSIGLGGAVIPA